MRRINIKILKLYCCIVLLLLFPVVSAGADQSGYDSYYDDADEYTSYPFDDFGGMVNDEYSSSFGHIDDYDMTGNQLIPSLSEGLLLENTDDCFGSIDNGLLATSGRRPGPMGYENSLAGGTITTPINDGVGILLFFLFVFLLFKRLKKPFPGR